MTIPHRRERLVRVDFTSSSPQYNWRNIRWRGKAFRHEMRPLSLRSCACISTLRSRFVKMNQICGSRSWTAFATPIGRSPHLFEAPPRSNRAAYRRPRGRGGRI
jgi:hypothetical protein